jgi:hypothetical protein
MRKVFGGAVKTSLLWIVLIGAMTALAGTSVAVLANDQVNPPAVCSGPCIDGACRFPLACFCDIGNVCHKITPTQQRNTRKP